MKNIFYTNKYHKYSKEFLSRSKVRIVMIKIESFYVQQCISLIIIIDFKYQSPFIYQRTAHSKV